MRHVFPARATQIERKCARVVKALICWAERERERETGSQRRRRMETVIKQQRDFSLISKTLRRDELMAGTVIVYRKELF